MQLRLQRDGVIDYQVERHNSQWPDHVIRSNITGALIAALEPSSVIDPACGDGSVVLAAHRIRPIPMVHFNDLSDPNVEALRPHLEPDWLIEVNDVFDSLSWQDHFDVIVLTEILEHIESPMDLVKEARRRSSYLVASSPEMRVGQVDNNPEHLWQFDGDGYYKLLADAGWQPFQKTHLAFPEREYDFGIWVCR
jgi:2-polyprenyl-3-methyl-5-hydroxy-6-metoxy-1,4-benzoquinol methylase